MLNIKDTISFAAFICGLLIIAGAIQAKAQPRTPQQTAILRIYEGVIFINPTSGEQLLKQDIKKLKYVQNETLTLTAADAVETKNGEYVFKIGFVVSAEPVGANKTSAEKDKWQSKIYELPEFVNRLNIGGKIIGEEKLKFTAEQSRAAYIFGRAQPVITTIRLSPGKNTFTLSLDDNHVILQPEDYKGWMKTFVIMVRA